MLTLSQCWHTDVGLTLVYQRWPNVDLSVRPMLAQRWHTTIGVTLRQRRYTNVVSMLVQRWFNVGAPPLGQRWANWQIHVGPTLVCRRWLNVRADVGPTLGQRRNASLACWLPVQDRNTYWSASCNRNNKHIISLMLSTPYLFSFPPLFSYLIVEMNIGVA